MNDDESFLRAVANDSANDSLRLIYADWLEERGDPRAEFLRLQSAFADEWMNVATFGELCEREQALVRELDPAWLQRVRRYTTAEPCRDLAKLVPDLAPYARTTTRLHPHRAARPLPLWASKIGGRFLWPTAEPWPSCPECQVNLTPVLQLRKCDALDIEFPVGADLLQLFWCPDEAAHNYQPAPRLFFRTEASVLDARTDDPDLSGFPRTSDWEGYIPLECSVHPERVIEYPDGDELYAFAGAEVATRIRGLVDVVDLGPLDDLGDRFEGEQESSRASSLVFYELTGCPATKLGGKPSWEHRGKRFDHLATFSTWECDSASFRRWLAVEDQRRIAAPGASLTFNQLRRSTEFTSLRETLGMQLGRTQRANVFVCRQTVPWEVRAYVGD